MLRTNPSIFRLARGCVAAALVSCAPWAPAAAWERPHSDGANSGFADVTTKAAASGSVSIPNIGSFAPGVGPVVAPDGTVYIGNDQGKLWAFHADGSPYWSRDIGEGQSIVASPAVGSDGMVYVIGVKQNAGAAAGLIESTLNRFTSSGGWLGQVPFPDHGGTGAAVGAPNIWKSGGSEIVMATAAYKHGAGAGHDVRLIAFSTSGEVLADTKVTTFVPTAGGGWGVSAWKTEVCALTTIVGYLACTQPGFTASNVAPIVSPPPDVGIFTYQGGGTPFVLVSDHIQDLVGYTFSGGAFVETFRLHTKDYLLRSAPMTVPSGHTLIGVEKLARDVDGVESPSGRGGVIFAGPDMNKVSPVTGLQMIYATPTRMADGRVILIGARGEMTVLQGNQIASQTTLPGGSVVPAAASRTHVFVSSADAFTTFDANTLQQVAKVDWVGGGVSPPAIGPKGHVYAIASNILFVFPAPIQVPIDTGLIGNPPQAVVAQPTTQPASQLYHPPLTTAGNRLFACEELDQDDCGNGDHQAISLAFCQKEGFAQADGIDVDSRKVRAETLDGRFCSKKKCKVFDTINCKN